jgi:hypothetical protein
MSENELNTKTKDKIRKYLLRITVPAIAIVSTVVALFGYFAKEYTVVIAVQTALNEYRKDQDAIRKEMVKLQAKTELIVERIESKEKKVHKILNNLLEDEKNAEGTTKYITDELTAIKHLAKNTADSMANELLKIRHLSKLAENNKAASSTDMSKLSLAKVSQRDVTNLKDKFNIDCGYTVSFEIKDLAGYNYQSVRGNTTTLGNLKINDALVSGQILFNDRLNMNDLKHSFLSYEKEFTVSIDYIEERCFKPL